MPVRFSGHSLKGLLSGWATPSETPQLELGGFDADAMTARTFDEHDTLSPHSPPRLVDRVYNLPFSLTGINVGLATHWIFSTFFGRSLFDLGALPPGAILAGGIPVLVLTAILPFAGMLARCPAQGVGRVLRAALGLLLGSRSLTRALARGWVPLRKARQAALAERDRYWTSRVDSALAACVQRARRADRVELQGFALLALLVLDASCSPALVPSLLEFMGLGSSASWLGCVYVLAALVWCWSVSRDVTSAAVIYHPVLAQQLLRERALQKARRAQAENQSRAAVSSRSARRA